MCEYEPSILQALSLVALQLIMNSKCRANLGQQMGHLTSLVAFYYTFSSNIQCIYDLQKNLTTLLLRNIHICLIVSCCALEIL